MVINTHCASGIFGAALGLMKSWRCRYAGKNVIKSAKSPPVTDCGKHKRMTKEATEDEKVVTK